MSTRKKPAESPWLHPLPLPDVVHSTTPLLQNPERVDGGRCYCCGADVKHRFQLQDSLPLSRLNEERDDVQARLDRAQDALKRLVSRQPPQMPDEREKYNKALKAARKGMQHASLAARRLALRHIPWRSLTETAELSEQEQAELRLLTPPFHLCYFCHSWQALNGYAAAQGVMAWLPDLHPRSVVALNRKALQAIFSNRPDEYREGRKVLTELVRHRLPLEDRFGGWRPADFADALRRFPPSMRSELREKMSGVALILTPDSVTDPDVLTEN